MERSTIFNWNNSLFRLGHFSYVSRYQRVQWDEKGVLSMVYLYSRLCFFLLAASQIFYSAGLIAWYQHPCKLESWLGIIAAAQPAFKLIQDGNFRYCQLQNYGTCPFKIRQLSIVMALFNSNVNLPVGNHHNQLVDDHHHHLPQSTSMSNYQGL